MDLLLNPIMHSRIQNSELEFETFELIIYDLKALSIQPPIPPKGGKKHQNGTISPLSGDLGGIAENKSKVSVYHLSLYPVYKEAVSLKKIFFHCSSAPYPLYTSALLHYPFFTSAFCLMNFCLLLSVYCILPSFNHLRMIFGFLPLFQVLFW